MLLSCLKTDQSCIMDSKVKPDLNISFFLCSCFHPFLFFFLEYFPSCQNESHLFFRFSAYCSDHVFANLSSSVFVLWDSFLRWEFMHSPLVRFSLQKWCFLVDHSVLRLNLILTLHGEALSACVSVFTSFKYYFTFNCGKVHVTNICHLNHFLVYRSVMLNTFTCCATISRTLFQN